MVRRIMSDDENERQKQRIRSILHNGRRVEEVYPQISIDDSADPWVTLMVNGHEDIRFNPSEDIINYNLDGVQDLQNEIAFLFEAAHQAYLVASKTLF